MLLLLLVLVPLDLCLLHHLQLIQLAALGRNVRLKARVFRLASSLAWMLCSALSTDAERRPGIRLSLSLESPFACVPQDLSPRTRPLHVSDLQDSQLPLFVCNVGLEGNSIIKNFLLCIDNERARNRFRSHLDACKVKLHEGNDLLYLNNGEE